MTAGAATRDATAVRASDGPVMSAATAGAKSTKKRDMAEELRYDAGVPSKVPKIHLTSPRREEKYS